jgi:pilus assembly protein Flp/PilA
MLSAFAEFLRDEEGATMVEYGIMVALIAAVSIGIVATLGQSVSGAFNNVNTSMNNP